MRILVVVHYTVRRVLGFQSLMQGGLLCRIRLGTRGAGRDGASLPRPLRIRSAGFAHLVDLKVRKSD